MPTPRGETSALLQQSRDATCLSIEWTSIPWQYPGCADCGWRTGSTSVDEGVEPDLNYGLSLSLGGAARGHHSRLTWEIGEPRGCGVLALTYRPPRITQRSDRPGALRRLALTGGAS